MNKKGMLLASEVIKIVLGLIGIALLVYLLVALYFTNVDQKKFMQAQSTIEIISGHINEFQYNPSYVGEMYGVTPIKWTIFSYTGSELKPNQCSFENCICICDEVREDYWLFKAEERQEKECSKDGACLIVSNLDKFENIYIPSPSEKMINLKITLEGGLVKVRKI